MRGVFALVLCCLLGTALAADPPAEIAPPALAAKAFILTDYHTGQVLASQNPDDKVEPASLTKLMTAYLTFAAIKSGQLKLDQVIPVSEKAWKAEGSRMFIEPKKPPKVEELLHGMIIQSGNDACIALAETLGGSEDAFAERMNKEAKRLGMNNSNFTNATGLPNAQHYSTARDLSLLAAAVIRDFPEFFPIYAKKEYRYNNISQPNRNRLLWMDPTVDGMKTGHTEAAGYCLVATARRENRRLVSVVLGTSSDTVRALESQKLLNFGMQYFESPKLYAKGQSIATPEVWKGRAAAVKIGFDQDIQITIPKGRSGALKANLETTKPLVAPLTLGQQVGKLRLTLDDKLVGEYPVKALEAVEVAGLFGRMWDSMRLMFNK